MTTIRIKQKGANGKIFSAVISFDDKGNYPVSIKAPFSKEEEKRLGWYFEEYYKLPFVEEIQFKKTALSIREYGENLFKQIFNQPSVIKFYLQCISEDNKPIRFEITGDHSFHALHWETLKDPDRASAWSLAAPLVRKIKTGFSARNTVSCSPAINLLIVTARPGGAKDAGLRTVIRPLVEGLEDSEIPAKIHILRPGTFKALTDHLASRKAGFYHIIHLDVHGELMTFDHLNQLYGESDVAGYNHSKPYIFLENPEGGPHPVSGDELATLLTSYQIPMVILNACKSDKHIGKDDSSLAISLLNAGVAAVIAMRYNVFVAAASKMMEHLYKKILDTQNLSHALYSARKVLHDNKKRPTKYGNFINIEDWMLPVLYESVQEINWRIDDSAAESDLALFAPVGYPDTTYPFVGRDLDVLEIERRLLTKSNLLVIKGMIGIGKSTFMLHLGAWWQRTNWVQHVFYFNFNERRQTLHRILKTIAAKIFASDKYKPNLNLIDDASLQEKICEALYSNRHLLILDHSEPVSCDASNQNAIDENEYREIREFLDQLINGETLILVGSRGSLKWLEPETFAGNQHELMGLDSEAASMLANDILKRYNTVKCHTDPAFRKLFQLLNGNPLALETVLPDFKNRFPEEILSQLVSCNITFKSGSFNNAVNDFLGFIEHSCNLSFENILILAPFTSVVNMALLEKYIAYIDRIAVSGGLKLRLNNYKLTFQHAQDWGLLTPYPGVSDCFQLHPMMPFYLRTRLNQHENNHFNAIIRNAFYSYYAELAGGLAILIESAWEDKENIQSRERTKEKELGLFLADIEYENLITALNLALDSYFHDMPGPESCGSESSKTPFESEMNRIYKTIFLYLDSNHQFSQGLELNNTIIVKLETFFKKIGTEKFKTTFDGVLNRLEKHPRYFDQYNQYNNSDKGLLEALAMYIGIMDTNGKYQLYLDRFEQAERSYRKALSIYQKVANHHGGEDDLLFAGLYHQIGRACSVQDKLKAADRHFKRAYEIKTKLDDRPNQALTLHELGETKRKQLQFRQARKYFMEALSIFNEQNDIYNQAKTNLNLGIACELQGSSKNYDEAVIFYQKANRYYRMCKADHDQANVLNQLGNVLSQRGTIENDHEKLKNAESNYHDALRIFKKYNDEVNVLKINYNLGVLAHERGSLENENRDAFWEQAEHYYQKVLKADQIDPHVKTKARYQLELLNAAPNKSLKPWVNLAKNRNQFERFGLY